MFVIFPFVFLLRCFVVCAMARPADEAKPAVTQGRDSEGERPSRVPDFPVRLHHFIIF